MSDISLRLNGLWIPCAAPDVVVLMVGASTTARCFEAPSACSMSGLSALPALKTKPLRPLLLTICSLGEDARAQPLVDPLLGSSF